MLKKKILIIVLLLFILSSNVWAEDFYKDIKVHFNNIKILIDGNEIKMEEKPFIYNNRVYVPVRFVSESLNKKVKWDADNKVVLINGYKGLEECDPRAGENFVYGIITDINYDERIIAIDQQLGPDSKVINEPLKVRKDVNILLKWNDKYMNLDFKDLKVGYDFGLILDKENLVRGIIIEI
ncbi:MAG: copper amine oxidase N-terminal domain-containing protein [Firmicutes bacterium]|nr:copper amine oxidase N-terminal domain-containing protein [Bacillota bacterium]